MSCDVASASVAAPTGRGNGEDSSSAAVNEKPNGNAEEEIYRGRLLQLSHFLTRFQAFYCFKNEKKNTITPRDIEEAWKYQFLLHKEAKLLDKKCSLEAELRIVSLAPYEDDDDFSMAENAQVDPSLEQQLGEDLRKIQDEIAKCSERDQQVLSLLQRFEVWTTKDIAHFLLMPDCGCKTLDDASCSCWSKLLNIPGAAYFADRWPLFDPLEKTGDSSGASGDSDKENAQGRTMQQQQKRQSMQRSFGSLFSKIYYQQNVEPKSHSLCSLVVPPNKYTWEEFLRVAHMVALLPDPAARQKAADSPCCGINKLIHQVAKSKEPLPKEKNIYATDYKFSAHDLVALWVRAQHSATAFRHLIKLYSWLPKSKIKELEKRQGRKGKLKSNTSSVDTTDVGDDSYAVFFVGNHKSTKRRVPNETKMIAALVEYFCINQVLITYQFMIEGMAKAELSKKRSREEAQHKTSRPQKRSKSTTQAKAEEVADEEAVDDSEVGLLRACQCFMLRWFAKRNQNLIAMLYESSESPGASESYSARTFRYDEKSLHFFEAYKQANITSSIQKYLKDENRKSSGSVSSSDRFFARIDRRVLCGKYEGKGCSRNSEECQFYAVVNRLLKAWRECIVKDQSIKIDPALLSSVQDDFDRIYKDFSRVMRDEGLMAAAKSLLDDKDVAECENPDEARSTLLLSMPAPWRDTSCATCKLSLKKHSPQTVTVLRCNVCERIFDERCCPEKDFRSVKIKELLLHANDMLQVRPLSKAPSFSRLVIELLTLVECTLLNRSIYS